MRKYLNAFFLKQCVLNRAYIFLRNYLDLSFGTFEVNMSLLSKPLINIYMYVCIRMQSSCEIKLKKVDI